MDSIAGVFLTVVFVIGFLTGVIFTVLLFDKEDSVRDLANKAIIECERKLAGNEKCKIIAIIDEDN